MPKYKVAFVNFPGDGKTAWQCSAWVTKTFFKMKQDDRISEISAMYYGPDTPITMMRNRSVKDALDQKCDYILMIDSDISPDSQLGKDPNAKPFWDTAWEFMMNRRHEKGRGGLMPATIGAPYCGPPPHECCYIFRWKNFETDGPDPGYKLEMIEREDSAFRMGIEEVAALPTGLILYDIRLFDMIPKPWYDYEWTDDTESYKASTEDVYQTRNASLCGCPQFVAWDCWADHIKTKVVTKPRPLTVECLSEKFHEAIKGSRTAKKRLMFLGEPDGKMESVEMYKRIISEGYKVHGRPPTDEFPCWSGRGSTTARTDGKKIQDRDSDVPVERGYLLADERLVHEDDFRDEEGCEDR